jgi:hypothetical protein
MAEIPLGLVRADGDNAGENKSKEIMDFFDSVGVRNHFSTTHEQGQNGLAEAAFNSIMKLARTVMAESRLGGRFWFKAACAGKESGGCPHRNLQATAGVYALHLHVRCS